MDIMKRKEKLFIGKKVKGREGGRHDYVILLSGGGLRLDYGLLRRGGGGGG